MSNETILVVDDEFSILEVMVEALEDKGYKVYAAPNGVEGLKICAENSIDLIVLDLNMPRMDGYMFMEHLNNRWEKEKRIFKFPKIIVLSAVDQNRDFGRSENLGALQFKKKPIKPSELIAAVSGLLAE